MHLYDFEGKLKKKKQSILNHKRLPKKLCEKCIFSDHHYKNLGLAILSQTHDSQKPPHYYVKK